MSEPEIEVPAAVEFSEPQHTEDVSKPEPLTELSEQKLPPAPVTSTERVASVDVLRGVALLGILAMNITAFAWPFTVYGDPTLATGYGWADLAIWMFNHIIFDTKMMTIFSMLFGAGLVLMSERAEQRDRSILKVYYRRVGILLIIGMIHAYLIWMGDILVGYALCGLALYPFRRRSGRTLVILGVTLMLLFVPAWMAIRGLAQFVDKAAEQKLAGVALPEWKEKMVEARKKMVEDPAKVKKEFDEEVTTYRSGYLKIVAKRAPRMLKMHVVESIFFMWWAVGGRMLLGMGLMKLGVFSAARSRAFYQKLALVGYGIGLPLVLCDIASNWHYDFFRHDAPAYVIGGWWIGEWISGPFMALGHVATVMLIYQSGICTWLTRRLAAVGRMALSNYLLDSIVFSTIFYGYGFDLFATVHRPGLMLMVLAMWAFQLWISPIWLSRFRFGPAEWVWRSLTYGKKQPMRLQPIAAQVEV